MIATFANSAVPLCLTLGILFTKPCAAIILMGPFKKFIGDGTKRGRKMRHGHIPYSVLDLSPIVEGASASDAFRNTMDLAQRAEGWGYNRY